MKGCGSDGRKGRQGNRGNTCVERGDMVLACSEERHAQPTKELRDDMKNKGYAG